MYVHTYNGTDRNCYEGYKIFACNFFMHAYVHTIFTVIGGKNIHFLFFSVSSSGSNEVDYVFYFLFPVTLKNLDVGMYVAKTLLGCRQ
jgi:hypothetical protein